MQQKFGDFTQNWLNFQPAFEAKETFKTTKGEGFKEFEERKEPFKLKDNALTADQKAL